MTRVEPPVQAQAAPRSHFHLPVPRFTIKRFVGLVFLVAVFWAGMQVARTGLVRLPFFTNVFYTAPEPRATAAGLEPGNVEEQLRAAARGTVTLSNRTLSDLAQVGADRLHLGIANVHVVGGTDVPLELSFIIPQRNNAIVRIDLAPEVVDGDLHFRSARTRIGTVDVPTWLIGEPTRLLLTAQLQPLLRIAPPIGTARVVERGLSLTFTSP